VKTAANSALVVRVRWRRWWWEVYSWILEKNILLFTAGLENWFAKTLVI